MLSTIRTGARLFKFGKRQALKLKDKISPLLKKAKTGCTQLIHRLKSKLRSLLNWFKPKQKKCTILLVTKMRESQSGRIRKLKKSRHKKSPVLKKIKKKLSKKSIKVPEAKKRDSVAYELHPNRSLKDDIQDFYKEWEASYGPALTSLDRKFLESAKPELAYKIMKNGRSTLKSPYLKAVYNGLKDLEDISDLIKNDEQAKQKVLTTFQDYYDRGPDVFYKMLDIFHDKGNFPTRSGERRLSLDTRLIPDWIGLAG